MPVSKNRKMKRQKHIQITESELKKIKKQATQETVRHVHVLFFTVMRDKEGYGVKRLQRLYAEVEDLSDSVNRGYVTISDLFKVLEEESGIVFK